MNRYLLSLLFFSLSSTSFASPLIQHWTTDSGIKVYFVNTPVLPMVDVRLIFDAGSAHEQKAGIAQLTNGLISSGTKDMNANQVAENFENVGAIFDYSSHRDMAVISLRVLLEQRLLHPAIDTLSQILAAPLFPAADLDREIKLSLVGLKNAKQRASSVARKKFFSTLYGDHPYAHSSSGTEQSLANISRADILKHYQDFYVSQNLTLAIVGALDKNSAKKLIAKITQGLKRGKVAYALPKTKSTKQAKLIKIAHPSKQTHILMGQLGVFRGDKDYYPLYLANYIFGGGNMSSMLFDEVRENRGLSYSVYSYFSPMRQQGPFIISLQTKNNQTDEALKVVKDLLTTFINQGPSEQQIKTAKQSIMGSFPLKINSNSKIVEYAAMIGFYGLPLDYLDKFNASINDVTLTQLKQTLKRRLQPDQMIRIAVGGKE